LGGIVIPAHVERTSYGLFPSLGLISDEWHVPALEISRLTTPEKVAAKFPAVRNYPLIQSGDVHRLNEFLGTSIFTIAHRTAAEIAMAFQNIDGRKVCIESK
jgi:hypothetical protein